MRNFRNNGVKAELDVAEELERECEVVKVKHTWGVDILIHTPKRVIKIEVKSAHFLVRNGKKGYRKGKFYFYPCNLERPDYFAFVIYLMDISKTFWVKGETIRNYFKNHKKETKLSLSIPALLNKIDCIGFGEVISDSL